MKKTILILISIVLLLSGCEKKMDNDNDLIANFKDVFHNHLYVEIDIPKAINILNNNILKLEKEDATIYVFELIDYLQKDISDTKAYAELIEIAKESIVNSENIDSFFENQSNPTVTERYMYLQNTFRKIKIPKGEERVNYYSYIEIDYSAIKDKYEHYINDDAVAMLDLLENQVFYLNDDIANEINYNAVLMNILALEEFIINFPESKFIDLVKEDLYYHYQSYLGYYEWSNVFKTDGSMSMKALKNYNELLLNYPDSMIAQRIPLYLRVLEEENYRKTTNVEVLLLDIANVDYQTYTEE